MSRLRHEKGGRSGRPSCWSTSPAGIFQIGLPRDHSLAVRPVVGRGNREPTGVVWLDAPPDLDTPVRGELNTDEALPLMEPLSQAGLLTSLDAVEVKPILGRGDRTAAALMGMAATLLGRETSWHRERLAPPENAAAEPGGPIRAVAERSTMAVEGSTNERGGEHGERTGERTA